jgi:anaerobic magnesium-protoporphyrin IX monomethyl ester cyclase
MKTVVLVAPPVPSRVRYGPFHRIMGRGIIRPHIGLLSLAAVLRRHGHGVRLVDALAQDLTPENTARVVMRYAPHAVAFTSYSLSITQAAEIARQVKNADPEVLTIVGGPHVSALPIETMTEFPAFDVGVIGEGERTLLAVVEHLGERDFGAIDGVVIRHGEGIRVTGLRPPIQDLDVLPHPAWDLLEGFPERYPLHRIRYRRFPVADVCTSRGCPYQCTFCDRSVFGSRYRAFSPGYVIEQVEWLRRCLGVREVMFKDDLIMADRERMVAICEGMLSRQCDLSWSCMGRADKVDRALLALMRRAGCWQISYGIESGNQAVLDRAKKNLALERVEEALWMTREEGISPRGFFILGLPGETTVTIRESIDFATRSVLEDVNVALFTPFPGTELSSTARTHGAFDGAWLGMSKFHAGFVPFGLTRDDLERSLKRFYIEFFARRRILWTLGKRMLARN